MRHANWVTHFESVYLGGELICGGERRINGILRHNANIFQS